MKTVKTRKDLNGYQFLFYIAIFTWQVRSSLHEKKVSEAILYSVALAASLFLAVLFLSGWGKKKPEQTVAEKENQEKVIQ